MATANGARRRQATPLRRFRMSRTMTQVDLATLAGIKRQTLALYESGELLPPPDRRAHLATLLGTTPDVLWPPVTARRSSSPAS
jgi:transcriptional regulator with XRE-family HTH domain